MLGSRRRWWRWGAIGVVAALASPTAATSKPLKVPALLAEVLKVEPTWRLLDADTDLVGDYTIKKLEDADRWPPWLEGDFDKDGKDDIAAVIVRRGANGENEFSVVAVHARTRGRGELVVPFGPQRIIGVSDQFEDDTVTPMYCLTCESNIWYRWNGRAYEPWLHNVGDTVLISSGEAGRRLTLFADPRPDASRTADVSLCTKAEVLEVGGREGQRWYRVEVDAPSSPRGWIPQQLVVEDIDCGK